MSNSDYLTRVTQALIIGKHFKLKIIGFTVTEGTIGAHVDLNGNAEMLDLWDNEFNSDEDNSILEKIGQAASTLGFGSRAHITIGMANGVKAVQTGFDLVSNLLLLNDFKQVSKDFTYVYDTCSITYLKDARVYIKLNEPYFFDSIFSLGFY
jgi:hypothetical protein